jgi:organic hydroperoxide reductase OsmC/OhrA
MAEHVVVARWSAIEGEDFQSGKYSRKHVWEFDSGQVVSASPSPSVVPVPFSDPSSIDPEEAFVAAVCSCHLLTFLYIASKRGWVIKRYDDRAVGVMTKNERRIPWVSRITLNPKIEFDGPTPTEDELEELHHQAHDQCFIANSIKTEVIVARV